MGMAEQTDITALFLCGKGQCQKSVVNVLAVSVRTADLMSFQFKERNIPDYRSIMLTGVTVALYKYAWGLGGSGPCCDLGLPS